MANLPRTPFHDLADYVALRRLGTIALSPDGSRLIAVASELNPEKTKYVSALWEVRLDGCGATRLTRSGPGETAPAILPDNSVLFVSKRSDPAAAKPDDEAGPALWLLPAGGGEARQVAACGGGISGVRVARDTGDPVLTAGIFAGTQTIEQDADIRKARKEGKISAILHEGYPVRFWDHDLGAEQPRLFTARWDDAAAGGSGTVINPETRLELTDRTGDIGRALADADIEVAADGSFAIATWSRVDGHTDLATGLERIDLATGERATLVAEPRISCGSPAISPDGATVAYLREAAGSVDEPHTVSLWLIAADGSGAALQLPLDGDLRPTGLAWSPDGAVLYFAADENGRAPVFALDVAAGTRRRLAADGAYASIQVHPDGRRLYAVRSSYTDPGTIVELDVDVADQQPRELSGPAGRPELPGELTEVWATAEDGTRIRSWLAVPAGVSAEAPAPLLLWVHGGPVSSWNAWSWRWCPWLMVAAGYAVLLPDPALSTGYGDDMLRRGWGRWGAEPYTDVMAATDAVLAEHAELDAGRTAMMGGSFGGYMANWIATQTDRFRAIVSHASLWDLPAFGGTTDAPSFWRDEMSLAMREKYSPSRYAADIVTPMLVIHGDKDYRVPIGEGLRLWWDLLENADDEAELPHRFLYFPDENHWVLTPNHAIAWYRTVLAFLAWHVLGEEFIAPDLL